MTTKKTKQEVADTTDFRKEMRNFVNALRACLDLGPLYSKKDETK